MQVGALLEKQLPDNRRFRGPHQKDDACFRGDGLAALEAAVCDLSWLLSRDYPKGAAVQLVGNRYTLRDRQRKALQHCGASESDRLERLQRQVMLDSLAGRVLLVDGYNVLLSLEAALSGGVLLLGRDGALRDMAAMSKHYRRVHTTRPALQLIAQCCHAHGCSRVDWYLDRPISNSGRLKTLIEEQVEAHGWPWHVRLVPDPDKVLIASDDVVATSDSAILSRCRSWVNLARFIVERSIPDAWLIDLSGDRGDVAPI